MNSREIEQAVVDNQNLVRFAINRYFPASAMMRTYSRSAGLVYGEPV